MAAPARRAPCQSVKVSKFRTRRGPSVTVSNSPKKGRRRSCVNVYRPTLRVKISTRGRAPLCQIVQKKVVIRVKSWGTRHPPRPACLKTKCVNKVPAAPCVKVSKCQISAGPGAPTDPVLGRAWPGGPPREAALRVPPISDLGHRLLFMAFAHLGLLRPALSACAPCRARRGAPSLGMPA